VLLANITVIFLCDKTTLIFENFLSFFISGAAKSLFVLDTAINAGGIATK
jgi:hypothetical protein